MRPADIIHSALLFAATTSAWPTGWGWSVGGAAKQDTAPLLAERQVKRATSSKFDLSFSATQGNTATTESSSSAKDTGKTDSGKTTATSSGKDSKSTDDGKTTGKATDSGKGTVTSKYQTTKTFDNRLPAGGVSMITPGPFAGQQYYKVADYVTFAWNYTSLSVTPSAVDVIASCSANSATYTIALNQTITGPTQAVTWDTGEYQSTATIPFVVATYTLMIYDAASSPDATARAGYLGTYNQLTFGMYTPQPYVPMQDFVCATCNSAVSSMQRHTLGFLVGTVVVTVLSFGWFAGVAGLW